MSGGTVGVAASIATPGRVDAAGRPPLASVRRRHKAGPVALVCAALGLLSCAVPATAASNKVRLTGLSDVSFGSVVNLGADAVRSQSLCLYADTATNGYSITATGSGSGGAFDLSSGARLLPFDVAWNSSPGQTAGAPLSPNVPLTGQTSTATQQTCNNGPMTSASLVVALRATSLSNAMAGTYAGTLTLIVGAE